MLTTRLVLGALIAGLTALLFLGWDTTAQEIILGRPTIFSVTDRIFYATALMIFYIPAWLVMAFTFFGLDAQGRIPRAWVTHPLTGWLFTRHETTKTPDGKTVTRTYTIDTIRACPSYYVLVAFASIIWYVGVVISLMIDSLQFFLQRPERFSELAGVGITLAGSVIMGLFIAFLFVLHGWISKTNNGRMMFGYWAGVTLLIAACMYGAYLLSEPAVVAHTVKYYPAVTQTRSLEKFAWDAGQTTALIVGISVMDMGALAGVIFLAIRTCGWLRNNVIGKWLIAAYNNMCLRVPVAPEIKAIENHSVSS